jgi:hypothetical protein
MRGIFVKITSKGPGRNVQKSQFRDGECAGPFHVIAVNSLPGSPSARDVRHGLQSNGAFWAQVKEGPSRRMRSGGWV